MQTTFAPVRVQRNSPSSPAAVAAAAAADAAIASARKFMQRGLAGHRLPRGMREGGTRRQVRRNLNGVECAGADGVISCGGRLGRLFDKIVWTV